MAKIYKAIVEYRDIILSSGIAIDDYSIPKKTIKRFIRLLKTIDDTRIEKMVEYPLYEIALIAFLTVLAGARTWDDIEFYGNIHIKYFKKFLNLKNGIPSHDTFRRVFSLIDPEQLQKVTVLFLEENMSKIKKALNIDSKNSKKLICIDGKEQRGTGRNKGSDGCNCQSKSGSSAILAFIHKI